MAAPIAAPLAWYPGWRTARAEERGSWRLLGGGRGIHWPAAGRGRQHRHLLAGQPSPRAKAHSRSVRAGQAES